MGVLSEATGWFLADGPRGYRHVNESRPEWYGSGKRDRQHSLSPSVSTLLFLTRALTHSPLLMSNNLHFPSVCFPIELSVSHGLFVELPLSLPLPLYICLCFSLFLCLTVSSPSLSFSMSNSLSFWHKHMFNRHLHENGYQSLFPSTPNLSRRKGISQGENTSVHICTHTHTPLFLTHARRIRHVFLIFLILRRLFFSRLRQRL